MHLWYSQQGNKILYHFCFVLESKSVTEDSYKTQEVKEFLSHLNQGLCDSPVDY